jgi:hypothetical protein
MVYELISIFIVLILYWFFNIKDQGVVSIPVPIEKMTDISIFDGFE